MSEPKHHLEGMGYAFGTAEWIASKKRKIEALGELELVRVVDILPDRKLLPTIRVY